MQRIAAVQGASSCSIQALMASSARRWMRDGARVTGFVESTEAGLARARHAARLRHLVTGVSYPIFQDLGPHAAACHLDSVGIVSACEIVCRDIERGCDLVVLSKFGQLETLRGGLTAAFAAAVERDIPILTAVSPAYQNEWKAFAAPLHTFLRPEEQALDLWWRSVRPAPER